MRRWAAVCLLALATAGCAPNLVPPGPAVVAPRLTDDAVIAADGARLPLRSWRPTGRPRAVLLAVHGFNDHASFFDDPGTYFATRGILSYAYDQRGFGRAPHHGRWPGVDALTGDLRTVAALIRARHPGLPLYLIGASMGGGVILAAMGGPDPPDVDGVILAAPAVWGRSTMPWYQTTALWIAAHTVPGLQLTGRGLHIRASDNIAMLWGLAEDPLFIKKTRVDALWGVTNLMDRALAAAPRLHGRVLLLYGAHDEIIPEKPIRELVGELRQAPAARLRVGYYDHGWHMLLRDLDAVAVWKDVAAWMFDPGSPLPSGADARAAAVLGGPAPHSTSASGR